MGGAVLDPGHSPAGSSDPRRWYQKRRWWAVGGTLLVIGGIGSLLEEPTPSGSASAGESEQTDQEIVSEISTTITASETTSTSVSTSSASTSAQTSTAASAPESTTTASGAATQAWSEDDIEYKLASLDAGFLLDSDDPRIAGYKDALDDAEGACAAEDRTELGDLAVKGRELLADQSIDSTNLELLMAMHDAAAGTGVERSVACSEIIGTVVFLMIEG